MLEAEQHVKCMIKQRDETRSETSGKTYKEK
jgi:hypothetical protein